MSELNTKNKDKPITNNNEYYDYVCECFDQLDANGFYEMVEDDLSSGIISEEIADSVNYRIYYWH